MGYNISNVDLQVYNVYYHIPSFSLVAVTKDESKKFIFQTGETLQVIFLQANQLTGWFEMISDITSQVNVNDLKPMHFQPRSLTFL